MGNITNRDKALMVAAHIKSLRRKDIANEALMAAAKYATVQNEANWTELRITSIMIAMKDHVEEMGIEGVANKIMELEQFEEMVNKSKHN